MADTDRVQKNLWTIVLVLVVIILLGYFISVSCLAGYCSTHDCKKIEGYQSPLDVDHIGNYYQIGQVGKEYAPRFQLSHGAGKYAFQENDSGYIGMYGDSRNVKDWKEKGYPDRDCIVGGGPPSWSNQRTPHTWMYSGKINTPKCGGCGYGSCMCCNADGRGCPVRFDDYSMYPIRRALPS